MGSQQAGLFCAIVQLMTKTIFLLLALSAAPALAQQPTPKTSEQQARTYITSAFMTGAAPLILSEDVVVQPELRQRLKLPEDANSRTVYQALVNLTRGKLLQVRPAIRDEVLKSQVIGTAGKPILRARGRRDDARPAIRPRPRQHRVRRAAGANRNRSARHTAYDRSGGDRASSSANAGNPR